MYIRKSTILCMLANLPKPCPRVESTFPRRSFLTKLGLFVQKRPDWERRFYPGARLSPTVFAGGNISGHVIWIYVLEWRNICIYVSIFERTRHHIEKIAAVWQRIIGFVNFAKCTGHFPPISTTATGSFGENDLYHNESYESSPPCSTYHWR